MGERRVSLGSLKVGGRHDRQTAEQYRGTIATKSAKLGQAGIGIAPVVARVTWREAEKSWALGWAVGVEIRTTTTHSDVLPADAERGWPTPYHVCERSWVRGEHQSDDCFFRTAQRHSSHDFVLDGQRKYRPYLTEPGSTRIQSLGEGSGGTASSSCSREPSSPACHAARVPFRACTASMHFPGRRAA